MPPLQSPSPSFPWHERQIFTITSLFSGSPAAPLQSAHPCTFRGAERSRTAAPALPQATLPTYAVSEWMRRSFAAAAPGTPVPVRRSLSAQNVSASRSSTGSTCLWAAHAGAPSVPIPTNAWACPTHLLMHYCRQSMACENVWLADGFTGTWLSPGSKSKHTGLRAKGLHFATLYGAGVLAVCE